jgi:hypothetical protein
VLWNPEVLAADETGVIRDLVEFLLIDPFKVITMFASNCALVRDGQRSEVDINGKGALAALIVVVAASLIKRSQLIITKSKLLSLYYT